MQNSLTQSNPDHDDGDKTSLLSHLILICATKKKNPAVSPKFIDTGNASML